MLTSVKLHSEESFIAVCQSKYFNISWYCNCGDWQHRGAWWDTGRLGLLLQILKAPWQVIKVDVIRARSVSSNSKGGSGKRVGNWGQLREGIVIVDLGWRPGACGKNICLDWHYKYTPMQPLCKNRKQQYCWRDWRVEKEIVIENNLPETWDRSEGLIDSSSIWRIHTHHDLSTLPACWNVKVV